MRYLMLVCVDEDVEEDADPEPWITEMETRGIRKLGNRLQPIADSTTVRVRNGEVLIADGPFADARAHGGTGRVTARPRRSTANRAETTRSGASHSRTLTAWAADPAESSQGGDRVRSWESLEHDLRIDPVHHGRGHVRLRFVARGPPGYDPDAWKASVSQDRDRPRVATLSLGKVLGTEPSRRRPGDRAESRSARTWFQDGDTPRRTTSGGWTT
ncbi:DUF6228 family protein [Cryptosporangium sp. NPDC051539]|uniref:DUF6228 family protein n=1 Tax=Cryptosporangium sp. NPDC051539 TaxID=3363962 RepID=UPI0037A7CE89